MKFIILTSLLIFSYLSVCAQWNKTQRDVIEMMANDKQWTFYDSEFAKDGTPFLLYVLKEKANSDDDYARKIFYFGTDECTMIKSIGAKSLLDSTIKEMNSKFTPQGNNIWYDNYKKSKYTLVLIDGAKTFEVDEVELVLPLGAKQ